MTEVEKKEQVKTYFDENIFKPAIDCGKTLEDKTTGKKIVQGVTLTRNRMFSLSTASKMISFFWSAMAGTDRSIKFAELMKDTGLTRFEDVFEDVRVRFKNYV